MQVLGQVARELGFHAEFLTELCEPDHGIKYGIMKLKKELQRFNYLGCKDALLKALQRYNGGSNQNYANEVLALMEES